MKIEDEEALKYLKDLIDGEPNIGAYNTEVLKTAICALEKRIPKKTRKEHPQIKSYIPSCGSCGGIMDLLQGELNYCPNCGQAIDWEDYE